MDRGDLDGALADCQEAIQLQPQRFGGYFNIGVLEETRRNLKGAFKAFAQAAERVPTGKSRDYIEFAMYLVRAQLGRADEATNSLSAGMKRLLAGDKKTAADYFTRCLATKRTRFAEYILASAELKSL
jgi:tetratricopeptide (TPR) repeat protein